jgi:hypothetical protein
LENSNAKCDNHVDKWYEGVGIGVYEYESSVVETEFDSPIEYVLRECLFNNGKQNRRRYRARFIQRTKHTAVRQIVTQFKKRTRNRSPSPRSLAEPSRR